MTNEEWLEMQRKKEALLKDAEEILAKNLSFPPDDRRQYDPAFVNKSARGEA